MFLRQAAPVFLAVALRPAAAPADCVNIAVNGGFETGKFSGWTPFETQPGNTIIIRPGSSSTFAARIDNTAATSGAVIRNANISVGTVVPGETVTIAFDARGVCASGGVAFAGFFSEVAGGGVSSSVLPGSALPPHDADPDAWTTFTFKPSAGPDVSGGVTLHFAAVTGADPGSTMLLCVDNASVTVAGAVTLTGTG